MFEEIVVIDYITDINSLTSDQVNSLSQNLINSQFLENCPNGTIIGRPVSGEETIQNKVYYPFFSHMRFPIKAGERAWAFDQGKGLISFWLSRKVQNGSAEDLNFTHQDREKLYPGIKSQATARETISKIFWDSSSSGVKLSDVRKNSISRKEFSGEPVVPIKSRSVDLTLQGSNGTGIKMSSDDGAGSGTIDIVAGLATTSLQLTVENSEKYFEVIKPIKIEDPGALTAGDLNSADDSRITVSRSFNADSYYSLTGDESGDVPTIAIKSDAIRVVSNGDLKIIAGRQGVETSIVIKNDGNVIITPGAKIKLSGDLDDQPYLRYDQFNTIINDILDILGALQSSLGPSSSAGASAAVATTAAGNPPGTPTGDAAVDAAVAAINVDRFAEIGISTADILTQLEAIKSQKILGS